MLKISKKSHGLSYSYIWFAEAPLLARALAPVVYMQCRHQGPAAGYGNHVFHTLLIDLAADADTLVRTMSRNTSYKIKRAGARG